MIDAYKVGITIALTNKVSSALGLIGRELTATDAKAIRLKATLKSIGTLAAKGFLIGGAGYLGLHTLDKSYEVAKRYEQVFNQFKSLNLGDSVNKQADKFARGANIIGASATDLMETTRDLTTVLGNYGLARQLAPGFAQLKFANQAVYGGHGIDFNEGQLRSLEKIIEMKGGFRSAQEFLGQASMMQQVIAGTGGMVKPSDYLAFIKTAGVSGRLLSDSSFYYGMEPLIQELSGNRVGTALMSAYNNLGQGRATVRAAKEMLRLGIVDPSMVEYDKIGQVKRIKPGALKGMEQFTSNPYQWMKDVLLPAMAGKGITSKDGALNEMGALMGNRTASNLFSLMYLQQSKIEKNMGISKNAMGVDALVKLAKSSPQGAEMALGKAWENLNIAIGESLIPIIIPGLIKLADLIRDLGRWINQHPVKFDYLVKGFAALSAAMAISAVILLTAAGFKALGLALRLTGITPMLNILRIAFVRLGAMFLFSGPVGLIVAGIGLALVGAYEVYKHWDVIKPKLLAVWDGIKGWLSGILDWIVAKARALGAFFGGGQGGASGAWDNAKLGIGQPAASGGTQHGGNVYLDGHKVGQIVTRAQVKHMNGPSTGPSFFDHRQSYMPLG